MCRQATWRETVCKRQLYDYIEISHWMNVKQGAIGIPDGGSYDFGNVALCIGNYGVSFTIENKGAVDLILTNTPRVQISGTDASCFSVSVQPCHEISISCSFTLKFTPTVTGIKTATVNKDIFFTIENLGDGDLNLTGTPIVNITGADASSFTVVSEPYTPVYLHSSSTVTIRFTPVTTGTKTALVSIANNDPDKNPYTFTITGYGTPVIEKSLSLGVWTEGNIDTAGAEKYYSFYTTTGRTYIITWDDSNQGSGTYTCDVKMSAYR